jgi:hypothetical protein
MMSMLMLVGFALEDPAYLGPNSSSAIWMLSSLQLAHFSLAYVVYQKEMRLQPTKTLHIHDLLAIGTVWFIGPLAWAKERRRLRESD